MESKKSFKKIHEGDLKALIFLYDLRNLRKSYPFWAAIFCAVLVLSVGLQKDPYVMILYFVDVGYKTVPTILGLSIASFGMILSMAGSSLISDMVDNDLSTVSVDGMITASTFQKILAIITWAVLVQAYSLIMIIAYNFTIEHGLTLFFLPGWGYVVVNSLFLLILSFVYLYAIFLIPRTILNLFTFGQMNNALHLSKLIEAKNKKEKDSSAKGEDTLN